jgi:hypothetical protein
MTATDVANALQNQNLEAAPGALGQQPASRRQAFELPIDTLGRLTTTEQFGNIIVKAVLRQPSSPTNAPVSLSAANTGLPAPGSGSSSTGVTMVASTTPTTGSTTSSTSAVANAGAATSAMSGSTTGSSTSGGSTTASTGPTTQTTSGTTTGTTGAGTAGTGGMATTA